MHTTTPVTCPYCNTPAQKVTGGEVYAHRKDLNHKIFWRCPGICGAWVGCHIGTEQPLGRLANAELRRAKRDAHAAFDPLWKARGSKNQRARARSGAYAVLAKALGIPAQECHIGMFDVILCQRTVQLAPSLAEQIR